MNIKVTPSKLCGDIEAISSKSHAHRLLIASALSDDKTEILCKSTSADIDATVNCLNALGADIKYQDNKFIVEPIVKPNRNAYLDCGESGSTLRFLLPVVCALGVEATIKMHGKLPKRPISPLAYELEKNGAVIIKNDDVIKVSGKLKSGNYRIAGNISSQFISGLLFALPLLSGKSNIIITEKLESANYVKMTQSTLEKFDIGFKYQDSYEIEGKQIYHSPKLAKTEGDWSNSAFWLAAGILSENKISCNGLSLNSTQGDKKICDIIESFGGKVKIEDKAFTTVSKVINGIEIDCSEIPDLVPEIAVLACAAKGFTVIKNAERLRIKESNRLKAITESINLLGGDAKETEDGIIINGKGYLNGGTVDSINDHRIAMMCAISAQISKEDVIIFNSEAVNKSYPNFWQDYKKLGGQIEVIK